MKTLKKLVASLLAIAMLLSVLSACSDDPKPTEPSTGSSESTGALTNEKCTVTFYNNGEVYETVEVTKGETLTLPKDPKGESGKGLYGWSTIDGDMEEVIDPATLIVNADMKLYAVWADVYDVVINADNGTPFTVLEVFAGTIIEQPADPVKEGYRFVEWRDALNETPFDFSQPIYADVTIKAMYGDGAENRVSETKWDFSTGIHGSWVGDQSAWGKVEDSGIACKDMVFYTVDENGYAAWGFTKADENGNIPTEITGVDETGYGMKILCNEGISVEASKAKLVVLYVKAKYFPIDVFRISVLTSEGGKIYGYGSGQEDWAIRTDTANKDLVQVDLMDDGWYRVQYKIYGLPVWSEDAIVKGFSFGIVQRPSTPVMDIISVKSIELLDQEEFIDPHQVDYITKDHWDMSSADDSQDWAGAQANGSNTNSVTTTVGTNGTTYVFGHTNAWRGLTLTQAQIDMSKLSGVFSVTLDISGMAPTNYRLYIKTDAGGDLYKNTLEDVSCYYTVTSATELTDGWSMIANADGTLTITYDLTKLAYWTQGTTLLGLSFVTVDSTTNGTIVYKSISLVDAAVNHDCEVDGHAWLSATCAKPKTCSVCGVTEGKALGHSWKSATCTAPKTCKRCGETSGEAKGHSWNNGICSTCGEVQTIEVPGLSWDMSKTEDSAQWYSAQNKTVTDKSYITVTDAGSVVTYTHTNAWKGIVLTNQNININELSGKLYVTYSSAMSITQYRIYILTDKGGDLAYNDEATSGFAPENYYIAMKISDIAGSDYWTYTENSDGTVTVCFDLSSLSFFVNGNVLRGLTFCTVSGSETGDVVYKTIELTGKSVVSSPDECETNGHQFKDATCVSPKTCSVCGTTEGEALGHTWVDATCAAPKTCSVCKATEGETLPHTWVDATCEVPKTCFVCGATEGDALGHTWVDGICFVCGASEVPPVTQTQWDMSNETDSGHWISLQDKIKTDTSVMVVTDEGSVVTYSNSNAWKGIKLSNAAIEINENTSHLTFTYSSALSITQYRVYVLTDVGGDLAYNDEATSGYAPANYYVTIKLTDIESSEAWSSVTNADGSITVTFDLTTLPFYKDGTVLKGLSIVTVASGTGNVTYKGIALQKKHDCETDGHIWADATCTAPKTCSACGATEGEALGHNWVEATCTAPKTCSVCNIAEGETLAHNFVDGICSVCSALEFPPVTQNNWDMSDTEDSALWYSVQNKTLTNTSTITVNETGSTITYSETNGWKGIRLDNAQIDITKLNGKLTFTYSTGLSVSEYRIYVLTDKGGDLAYNDQATSGYAPANYYVAMKVANMAASTAWTATTNEDGSITVTFDLTTIPFFAEGTILKGLTIVTVASGTGDVTYKNIALNIYPYAEVPTTLKVLAIGNSFSVDAMEYLYQLAKSAGVETVILGNLRIGGCTIDMHYANAVNNSGSYTYLKNVSGTWVSTEGYTLAEGIKDEDWDFITLQQASQLSGMPDSYGNLGNLIAYVEQNMTNSDAKLLWHMTWAYQQDSTHSGFVNYNNDQETMYKAIVSTVNECVLSTEKFSGVIPAGTAVQNARTSFMGDTLTRDGYHMVQPFGRYLVGLTYFAAITGADISDISYLPATSITDEMANMAKEAVKNAMNNKFEVTQSSYKENAEEDTDQNQQLTPEQILEQDTILAQGIGVDLSGYGRLEYDYLTNQYYISTSGTDPRAASSSQDGKHICTEEKFAKEYLLNAVIICDEGWQYRPEVWVTESDNAASRPGLCSDSIVLLNEAWWGDNNFLALNICANPQVDISAIYDEAATHVRIYVLMETSEDTEPTHDCETEGHIFENGVCSVCGEKEVVTQNSWDMSKTEDSAQWYSAQNKTVTDKSYITVTEEGSVVTYTHTNGWKGIRLENAEIPIASLSQLTFTYSSAMSITNYRIYILTDKGGHLSENAESNSGYAPENYYASIAPSAIADSAAWTSTTNEDGSITVTFDLTTLAYWSEGTVLKGLTIVTVANNTTGDVVYKEIALTEGTEKMEESQDSQTDEPLPAVVYALIDNRKKW